MSQRWGGSVFRFPPNLRPMLLVLRGLLSLLILFVSCVLTGGTETGTVHDSGDFLTPHRDTLWCPVLCVLSATCVLFV